MKKNDNILDKFKEQQKQNSFDVPENYFENFQEKLNSKIKEDNSKVTNYQIIKPYLMVAASFALLFMIWKTVAHFSTNNSEFVVESEMIDEIENYENYELYALSDNELSDYLSDNDGVLEKVDSKDAIIDYLIEEDLQELEITDYELEI